MVDLSLQALLQGAIIHVTVLEEESGIRAVNEKEYSYEEFCSAKLFKVRTLKGYRFSLREINCLVRQIQTREMPIDPDDIIFTVYSGEYSYREFLDLKCVSYWGVHVSFRELRMLTSGWVETRKEIARLTQKAVQARVLSPEEKKRRDYLLRLKQMWVDSERTRNGLTTIDQRS